MDSSARVPTATSRSVFNFGVIRQTQHSGRPLYHVVLVVRDEPERWNVRHEQVTRSRAGQLLDQLRDVRRRGGDTFRAVVIEKVVAAAPDNIQRRRIQGVDSPRNSFTCFPRLSIVTVSSPPMKGSGFEMTFTLARVGLGGGSAERVIDSTVEAVGGSG